jgi:hypothetical protein
MEECDKRGFLFAVQVPYNAGGLGSIIPGLDGLHGDTLVV